MKTKTFDCVEMKRKGAERIREETKGMTFEQKVEYWRRQNEDFRTEYEQARRASGVGVAAGESVR